VNSSNHTCLTSPHLFLPHLNFIRNDGCSVIGLGHGELRRFTAHDPVRRDCGQLQPTQFRRNKAIVDNRLRPLPRRCATRDMYLIIITVEQSLVGIDAVVSTVSLSLHAVLYRVQNMMSSTKPEVRIVSHCRRRRTEPRSRATCTQNLVKFGCVVSELCEQTNQHTRYNTSQPFQGGSKEVS